MCAGLTISDKPALLDAKRNGYDSAVINLIGYPEEVNISIALAQIAEMEKAKKSATVIPVSEKPLTWNERINQMTVEEKARYLSRVTITCPPNASTRKTPCKQCGCVECWTEYLASPYPEGEKHEG